MVKHLDLKLVIWFDVRNMIYWSSTTCFRFFNNISLFIMFFQVYNEVSHNENIWWPCCNNFQKFVPGTLKWWVGVQWGQYYLMGERCLFRLGLPPIQWWCHNENNLWGRCFITLTSFTLHWPPSSWTLVVAVISFDAYHFFCVLRPGLLPWIYRIGVFWLHCVAW